MRGAHNPGSAVRNQVGPAPGPTALLSAPQPRAKGGIVKLKNSSGLHIACAILALFALALSGAHAGATRNVIIMIGDGMGPQQVNAASYYLNGVAGTLCFEPYYKCGATTYSLDNAITDSAAAATALATGHKTNNLVISQSPAGAVYQTILEKAKAMGKRTGLVGTDPITRATPGAFGSHDPNRYNYIAMGDDYLNSSRPDVMMGGGGTVILPLITYFSDAQIATAVSLGYQAAYTKAQMDALSSSTNRVLGLFSTNEMTYEYDRPVGTTEPHLSEMTAKALALLDTDPDGFFLMVEGAKIDYGAHANDIIRTTWEAVEFNNSVQTVLNWMQGRTDTLLIVTGDHETGGLTATNQGKGNYAGATWSSTDHTAANVPVYAYGSNSDLVNGYISGGIVNNTDIYKVMSAAYTPAPYKIYDQFGYGTGGNGNIYYGGGVFDGTFYTGQITAQAQQWRDEQIGGTALINATPFNFTATPPASPANIAKVSLPLGGYIYMGNGAGYIYRTATWDCAGGLNLVTGVPVVTECICTDGTYIYMTSGASSDYYKVHKLAVNHIAGSVSEASGWPITVVGSTVRFRGISYYNGKLYLVNFKAAGQVWEMDAGTGAFTQIATNATGTADSNYQAVRYGNQLFIVGLDDNLYTYGYAAGSWSLSSTANLGVGDCYGIGVKGDGTTAKYAWVTHLASSCSFWDLNPWTTPTNLGDPNNLKNGYPVWVGDAVVTVIGVGGFWVENKERTAGAHVLWAGEMPAVNTLVTIEGVMATSGGVDPDPVFAEKTLTATEVTSGGAYTVRPLFSTNKSMGRATGGSGLANDGLLVTVCGKVKGFDWNTWAMYIDDGSGVDSDIPPTKGLKVCTPDWGNVPDFELLVYPVLSPCFAVVTGVVRLEKLTDGTIIRRIDARSGLDIILTALP